MDCIYLAAGIGKRFKKELPKQFYKLNGKPILIYALEVLEKIDWIDKILVTHNKDYKELYVQAFEDYNISKVVLIEGGKTRQESVYKALEKVKTQKVFIHEAARPFIFESFVNSFNNYVSEVAVVPTIPIPFTVSEGDEYMTGILDRNNLHNIQLPQMFDTEVLKDCHKKAIIDNFEATEDSLLVFKYGHKVRFIEGIENNIKITTPLDILIAEQFLGGFSND
jgi:2-C-methyl-D-erythritol 4-phosphate cytidylyltransferase